MALHREEDIFVDGLIRMYPFRGIYNLDEEDILTTFEPSEFGEVTEALFDSFHAEIRASVDPELRQKMDEYLSPIGRDTPSGSSLKLGANSLRTILSRFTELTDDYVGDSTKTNIQPYEAVFTPTDWWHIQAHCNRLPKEPQYWKLAREKGWLRAAYPLRQGSGHVVHGGRVPSYVAAHVVVTGEDSPEEPYLVMMQRPAPDRVHYYPFAWSISLEENMHGNRVLNRKGFVKGDSSLHACAYRGLEEELGLTRNDVSLKLLGLFHEADFASVGAVFWAHTHQPWQSFVSRMAAIVEEGGVLEVNVLAREPLTTDALADLILADEYEASNTNGRVYFVPGDRTGPEPFHPTSRARLLLYLLADAQRHPRQELIDTFRRKGMEF